MFTTRLLRSFLLVYYLALIVLTIPLAFDVGGVECGLCYSLAMVALYFGLTTLRLATRRLPFFRVALALYYSQHVLMPSVLVLFLHSWHNNPHPPPLLQHAIDVWRYLLVHLTLVFTVAEGFCSLLLIQAASQTLLWLTAYLLDLWLFVLLIGSGCTITGALYFLYRMYIYPLTLDLGNALLLGSFLTVTAGLGLYGIVSAKGSMIESSLLFAYIVRCIYETFPLLSADATLTFAHVFAHTTSTLRLELAHLPPPVAAHLLAVVPALAANLPHAFVAVWDFFFAAVLKLSMPLLFNLAYRIGVFYAATKIIPLLYHTLPPLPTRTPQRSTHLLSTSIAAMLEPAPLPPIRRSPAVVRWIYAYSPCIIIPVYTHLMLLYSGELGTELKLWGWWANAPDDVVLVVHPWQFWNWINMGTTLLLYMVELSGNDASAITNHWKVD